MCACKQKKSFLIADILSDNTKKKPYKNLSNEPPKPLVCNETNNGNINNDNVKVSQNERDYKITKFSVHNEVRNELDLSKINIEQRRNTYPLYPMAMKPNYMRSLQARKETNSMAYLQGLDPLLARSSFSYYSDPMISSNQILRNQLVTNRFMTHQLTMPYGFDRASSNCCSPWWGVGGRRKGGQVRFTAAQTGALERRFGASKYLSPDERRALAQTLRLSDRQVKTWFQNRRAKWRRTAPESADAGSPLTNDEESDDEIQMTD